MKFKEVLVIVVPIFAIFVAILGIYLAIYGFSPHPEPELESTKTVVVKKNRGENQTQFNSWPYLIALRSKPTNSTFCGGSLISSRHIITGESLRQKWQS
jgi:hypothetical protein